MINKIINKLSYLKKLINKNFFYYFFLTKKHEINNWHVYNNLENRHYKKEVISFCNKNNFEKVLDYGCGFGDIIKEIRAENKYAYDNDPKIKKISKKIFNSKKIKFLNEKELDILKNKKIDCVLFINFLHDYNEDVVKKIILPFKNTKFILLDAINPNVKGFKYFHTYNFMQNKYNIKQKLFEEEPDRSFFILKKK